MPVRLARKLRLIVDRPKAGGLPLAALLVLLGSTSLQNAVADGDTRTLSFTHTHRDDSITVTFKRNGRYDEDGLKKLNYFLRDWRNDEQTKMDPRLFDVLWEVYREVDAKEPIHIVSSYRSPQTNAMLRRRSRGVAEYSQHMLGKAIDFFIPGVPLEQIRYAGLRQQRGGVGFYPTSGSPFVHVDVGSIRHWPRMTHDQLVRVFPDGKTVHVPTDGVPLKGYQQALAEVQRHGSTPSAMSLEAAHNAGIQTADAGGLTSGGGRNFFAKLFGIGQDDEDENEAKAPARVAAAAAPAAPARQQLAAVPIPRARPAQAGAAAAVSAQAVAAQVDAAPAGAAPAGAAPAGTFELASASTSAPQTPADIINSRGFWENDTRAPALSGARDRASDAQAMIRSAEAALPPEPPQALSPTGERLAWNVGPQGQDLPPRPPRDIEGVAAAEEPSADTTGSIASWADDPARNDRVPTDLTLAYAANTRAQPAATRAPGPMGSLRPANPSNTGNATIATKRPAANSPAAKIAQRNNDPWLRGILVTPSVHYSVSVAVLGAQDARMLRPLMHKPKTTLAMVFSNDPTLGLTSVQFSGPAVTFLPTLSYRTRTAGVY